VTRSLIYTRRPDPSLIAIDLSYIIDYYMSKSSLHTLFSRFPIQEIIEIMLSIPVTSDYSEVMFEETADRFINEIEDLDINYVEFIYDDIAIMVDEHIRHLLSSIRDYTKYGFYKWIDQTSVLLKSMY